MTSPSKSLVSALESYSSDAWVQLGTSEISTRV